MMIPWRSWPARGVWIISLRGRAVLLPCLVIRTCYRESLPIGGTTRCGPTFRVSESQYASLAQRNPVPLGRLSITPQSRSAVRKLIDGLSQELPSHGLAGSLDRDQAWPHSIIAFMTICDYHVTMKGIQIAELKSRLSEHLRKVRAGRTVTVLDRNTPIARIVPYAKAGGTLAVRPPLSGSPALKDVSLPPALRLQRDIVALLLEERQGDR